MSVDISYYTTRCNLAAAGVSLDFLVGEGMNAQFDKKTVLRLQEIQNMAPHIKSHLFAIIDSVIRDYKTQQSYKAI